MTLRPYQLEAVEAVLREWRGRTATLVVFPTGCGKTILFAEIIRRVYPKRVMVVAHREELIFQACHKIEAVTGLETSIEMADRKADVGARVIVSTVQTLTCGGEGSGRLNKFDPMTFGALIIDEFHHGTASTYVRVINWFTQNPELKILGVTATPDRSDGEALGKICESVAAEYEINDAVSDGWLVPIKQQMVNVSGLDFSSVKTTAGDLNGADLAAVMEREEVLHRVAGPTIEIIGQKKALAFCSSVAHAEMLCEIFNRHRSGMAGWVCGKTDKEERRKTLAEFSSGKIQVMCNCGVLTEGYDEPSVEVIVQGRPTKSRSLYAQMIGRSTRPLPGIVDGLETAEERRAAIAASPKKDCLVIDFVGNSGRHKLIYAADILGGEYTDEIIERVVARQRKTGRMVDVSEELKAEKEALKKRMEAEASRRAALKLKVSYTTQNVDPFSVFGIEPPVSRAWDTGRQLSEKQRGVLLKQGIDPDRIPYRQATSLIQELFRRWDKNLCSFKQAKLLAKHGYDTSKMTRDEASKKIDALAQNGWKRPMEMAV